MHIAYLSAKRNNLEWVKIFMAITTLLGVLFLIMQFYAWDELKKMEIYFVGNPSGSFLYVFTGVHGFHLVTGLIFLIVVLVATFRYKVHSKNMVQMEMCSTYWHFLDGLWLYLFMFILLNN